MSWIRAVVALAIGSAAAHAAAELATKRRYPPPGRLVEVNGCRLHLDARGEGPAVVLEAGLGGSSLDWAAIMADAPPGYQLCAYDRAGFGWSDRSPIAATPLRQAERLHALLGAAGIAPPYVLVGHSLGGLYAQVFCRRFPGDVAGLVLVDSAHPERLRRLPPESAREQLRKVELLRFARFLAPFGVLRVARQPVANAELPPPAREAALALGYRTKTYFAIYDEVRGLLDADPADLAELPMPDVPAVVLSSGAHATLPDAEVLQQLQAELVDLCGAREHVHLDECGHFIQTERPDAVVDAIRSVLDGAPGRARSSEASAVP